jgi:hypothetical protein
MGRAEFLNQVNKVKKYIEYIKLPLLYKPYILYTT